jgi:predicted metal-dependent hydrolase
VIFPERALVALLRPQPRRQCSGATLLCRELHAALPAHEHQAFGQSVLALLETVPKGSEPALARAAELLENDRDARDRVLEAIESELASREPVAERAE